jgi:hypothetical protein
MFKALPPILGVKNIIIEPSSKFYAKDRIERVYVVIVVVLIVIEFYKKCLGHNFEVLLSPIHSG